MLCLIIDQCLLERLHSLQQSIRKSWKRCVFVGFASVFERDRCFMSVTRAKVSYRAFGAMGSSTKFFRAARIQCMEQFLFLAWTIVQKYVNDCVEKRLVSGDLLQHPLAIKETVERPMCCARVLIGHGLA